MYSFIFTAIMLISEYSIPEDTSLEMYHHGQLGQSGQSQKEQEPDRPNFGMSPAEFQSLWKEMVSSGVSNATVLHFR